MKRRLVLQLGASLGLAGPAGVFPADAQAGKRVVVLTPYLTAPVTDFMVKAIVKNGQAQGWSASVIDSRGDMGQLVSRMEDTVASKADAIVLVSVDTTPLKAQIAAARAARIAVFGCDTHHVDGMVCAASSDDKAMSLTISRKLISAMGSRGRMVVFTHRPHPGVLQRTLALYEELKAWPQVSVLVERHVEVPGPIESARQQMENILLANPAKGSIAGVWAAFDAAAVGATQAIMAAGRNEIVVTGIDGDAQAVALIEKKSPLVATMRQDFQGISDAVSQQVTATFGGKPATVAQIDVPAILVTSANAGK